MSTFLDEVEVSCFKREIGSIKKDKSKPLVIFIGGIHGNEPMGVFALHRVFDEIVKNNIEIDGTLIALTGNLEALKRHERFLKCDLNRIWNKQNLDRLDEYPELDVENKEMAAIWTILKEAINGHQSERICIFDLHTTSSDSVPFITINDTLSNRRIASEIPVVTIFGIEEYLSGPLLSYINELGYNALGFEGGQHDSNESYLNHQAFVWLAMSVKGLIPKNHPKAIEGKKRLEEVSDEPGKFFEITYRRIIENGDHFKMESGYTNFQPIKEGDFLAVHNDQKVYSKWNTRMFMPLYQKQGDDGFFIVRPISKIVLRVSKYMRHYELERLLVLMPGVSMVDGKKHIIKVNRKIARFKARELFHFLGYRQKIYEGDTITFIRREKQ
jgi:succinylglutamate desuccinylase